MKGWLIFMMELSERIIKVLESHDISLCGEISERTYNNDGYDVDLETYSPEGEDVIIPLIYDGTEEDFIRQFRSYAEDFDVEEHAEIWIESRGKNGVPNRIKDLLDDAEWQKEMLLEVAKELEKTDGKDEEQNELNSDMKYAKMFCDAIRTMVDKPDNINNLESYLSNCFTNWLDLYGNNPENISHELKSFAEMKI